MEDTRTSTGSQRLAITFDTLIKSPEANITAIPVVRHEPFPTGNNRDIPVSVKKLVYGSKATGVGTSAKSLDRHNELLYSSEEVHGPRKDRGSSEGLDTHFFQRTNPIDKSLVEKPTWFQECASTSGKQGKESPKEKSEGKGKFEVEQTLPTELQNSKERNDSHGQVIQYGQNSGGIQKQGGGTNEPTLSKEIDLAKAVTHFEACNKQILEKLNNFEYIQQQLGREILQVKEAQKTIIGPENVNKDNILSLTHI
ncbi:hypothetical protein O181_001133, partial [Austropuccinia psidii MF-1]|nr:hypothetical protein [Austropuccinia psidii MF-1]